MNSLQIYSGIREIDLVEPSSLEEYLVEHGWEKDQEIDNRASIWSIQNGNGAKKYQLLLPLDQNLPDFEDRMIEALKTLEFVERRPISEVISNIINASKIANEKQREIFSLKFKFLENTKKREVPAKEIGSVLTSLQDLFNAVGQLESGRETKISKEVVEKSQLSLFETFKGSFGVKLALAPHPSQLNFLERPLGERVSESFLRLIKNSNQKDKQKLKEELIRLRRKSAAKYRKFLMSLISSKANLSVDWGSVNPEKGEYAELDYSNAIETIEFINKMEEEEPEEFDILGELIAANKKKKSFEIEDSSTQEKISGKVLDEILLNSDIELTIGKIYLARIREISSISPATGEEKVERTMISLCPRDDDL
ncbi:hypothetical protein [Coleofasciculus sp. E2-BRE-01]|uniref:hypothetical protein n=1 Tax=Coleofasciculus sp. E2-BRE-01 TaxID=3069524 RepID=UPI0032F149D6